MPERIDARPAITLAGGALLLISLFITWYEVPPVPPATEATALGTAWQVFESLDLVLAAAAIFGIYVAYEQITGTGRLGESWLLVLGLLALVVVGSQLLDEPPLIHGAGGEPATGVWLALGGAVAMVIGGILSIARVSLALELDSSSRSAATTRRRATQDA
jgi:hypothetical protein